ncbi:hypothetical protein [Micromonospora endolithica]|uniref:DUF624 domain-containing protein n=1 Tax=Micromonospora endolithica TaxID=230091 RepID=A0A3A9YUF2_9ACTN|nr:hypothetical protein [Micromonospora endolithica]RKN39648.1 hypothetical protein D7223_28545 [Micromonospora endolithica]TWJ22211.1 hypothetical protein JD76_02326 [Micromonospora endolithica]
MRPPQDGPVRSDWRDVLTDATDLALLGVLLSVAALPVFTAGAAVATASAAVHDRLTTGGWPGARQTLSRFVRAVPAGVAVGALALAAFGLLALDVAALAAGRVPGGGPLLLVTVGAAAALAGWAGLAVVQVGAGRGWRAAAGAATEVCRAHPGTWAAAGATALVAALLAVLVTPIALPILAGYALAALHAVARRVAGTPAVAPAPARPR